MRSSNTAVLSGIELVTRDRLYVIRTKLMSSTQPVPATCICICCAECCRCERWVDVPAIVFNVPHADNLFHFLHDGFIPVLSTLLDMGLAPDHVQRCAPGGGGGGGGAWTYYPEIYCMHMRKCERHMGPRIAFKS